MRKLFWIALCFIFVLLGIDGYSKADSEEETLQHKIKNFLLVEDTPEVEGQEEIEFNKLKALGPGVEDILLMIARNNYKIEDIRSIESSLVDGAIGYLGIFRYKKSVPLIREVMSYQHKDEEIDQDIKYRSLQALIRIDCQGNKDIIEKVLDPEKTRNSHHRYQAADLMQDCQSLDTASELLKKALPVEIGHSVVLRMDETLSKLSINYRYSQERKKLLLSKKPQLSTQKRKEIEKIKLPKIWTAEQHQEAVKTGKVQKANLLKYLKQYEKRIQEIDSAGKK